MNFDSCLIKKYSITGTIPINGTEQLIVKISHLHLRPISALQLIKGAFDMSKAIHMLYLNFLVSFNSLLESKKFSKH